jgi:hypothetical protein
MPSPTFSFCPPERYACTWSMQRCCARVMPCWTYTGLYEYIESSCEWIEQCWKDPTCTPHPASGDRLVVMRKHVYSYKINIYLLRIRVFWSGKVAGFSYSFLRLVAYENTCNGAKWVSSIFHKVDRGTVGASYWVGNVSKILMPKGAIGYFRFAPQTWTVLCVSLNRYMPTPK